MGQVNVSCDPASLDDVVEGLPPLIQPDRWANPRRTISKTPARKNVPTLLNREIHQRSDLGEALSDDEAVDSCEFWDMVMFPSSRQIEHGRATGFIYSQNKRLVEETNQHWTVPRTFPDQPPISSRVKPHTFDSRVAEIVVLMTFLLMHVVIRVAF